MSDFVSCVGCGATIHKTAPACPKCGAPQVTTSSVESSALPVVSGAAPVPWFRQRWFTVLCLMTITPMASLLAMTGDIHYVTKNGESRVFPKNIKTGLMIATLPWLMLTFGSDNASSVLAMVGLFVFALLLAFKK